jgi:hypothetical protein
MRGDGRRILESPKWGGREFSYAGWEEPGGELSSISGLLPGSARHPATTNDLIERGAHDGPMMEQQAETGLRL